MICRPRHNLFDGLWCEFCAGAGAEIAFEDPPGELEAVETLKVMFKEGAKTADILRFVRASISTTRTDITRVAAVKELLDRGYGKPGQAVVSGDGKPPLPPEHNLAVIARKVALAFRLAAMHAEGDAPMIEDASDGGD